MSTSSSRLESQKLIIVVLAVVSGILAVILVFGLILILWFCRRRRRLQTPKNEYYPSKSMNGSSAPTGDDFHQPRTTIQISAPEAVYPPPRPPMPAGFASFIASSQALDRPAQTSFEDYATTEGSFLHSPTMSTASNVRGSFMTPNHDRRNNSMRSLNRPPLPETPKPPKPNTQNSATAGRFDAYHRYLRNEYQPDNEDVPPVPPSRPRTKTPDSQNAAGK